MTISRRLRQGLERQLRVDQQLGKLHAVKCLRAILAIPAGHSCTQMALTLRVTPKTGHRWVRLVLVDGLKGLKRHKPPGRPSKLTKTQQQALAELLDAGPVKAGFVSACWRSPMMQPWIHERFGVYDHVFSLAQLRKNRGVSDQKATFLADQLNDETRHDWCPTTWPQILTVAKAKGALVWFGAAASFPPWGTLSSPWAWRGHQPVGRTSGKRKGDKVFGLIDYVTGSFCYQGHAERLHSDSSLAVLTHVWEQTQQDLMLIHDGAP